MSRVAKERQLDKELAEAIRSKERIAKEKS